MRKAIIYLATITALLPTSIGGKNLRVLVPGAQLLFYCIVIVEQPCSRHGFGNQRCKHSPAIWFCTRVTSVKKKLILKFLAVKKLRARIPIRDFQSKY